MKTIVLPVHSVCFASLTKGCGETSESRSSSASRLCGSWKKSTSASATTGPTPWTDGQFGLAALRHRGAAQLLDRAEAFEQVARGDDPDVADAEAEQEARAVGLALGLDRGEEVVDRLLLPPLAAEQFVAVVAQAENVGGRVEPAELDELGDRSSRPALRCRARRARRSAAAARTAGRGRSARRCSGRRPRPPRRPLRCRIRGNGRGRRKAARGSSRVRFSTTCGMTSPARWMRTRSPMRRPSRAISSRLWSVTLATITPPTPTGFSRPTGVSLPVRPTWMSIASSVVSAFSAGNLCASAQRGARPTWPSRSCQASRATL